MVSQAERRKATVAAILAAARKEFAAKGFNATTIDDIAARAGVAKGAVYHHFGAKEEIFERVLDAIMAEIADDLRLAAASGRNLVDSMVKGTEKYLERATSRGVNRILLIDGPAVLGWHRWRELDLLHFGRLMQVPLIQGLRARMSVREIEALFHLLTGAITEAALICATARNPKEKARELAAGIRLLLTGLTSENT
jgi:AcrR family transcriptional regulator